MVLDKNTSKMEIFIKDNILMDYLKDSVSIYGRIRAITKEILSKV